MGKKVIAFLLIIAIILGLFCSASISQTLNVKDYIKDKFPAIFSFYLSSLDNLDLNEKEFIDLLEKLPEEEQEYYAKEVYKNSFSLELLENVKEGKTIQVPASNPVLPSLSKAEEKPIESLPSLIKRIEPSIVVVFTYRGKFDIALKKKKEDDLLRLGSGFFISQSGDIITNYHVFEGAGSAEVRTSDGKTYPITHIVAFDEQNDIIRLSVNIPSQYVYPLSLSKTIPEVGERIIVYGSPLGWENTVSDGIVSAIRDVPDYGRVIQITAPISPGSSGSPVLNMQGEVIGVATFQSIEGQNLNFAIPSQRIADLNLMEKEKIFATEELFEQEEKGKKESDYAYEAYDKALYFIDKREYEKALPYLEIAIKTDISSLKAWAYFKIGFCYGELKSYAKAIEAYKQAIRIDPDFVDAYCNLGNAYDELGLYKDAIEAHKQAIRKDPDNAYVHFNLGVTYYNLSLYTKAIEAYKQAIRIDPDFVNPYFGLGRVYDKLGFYKEAIEAYKQAIRIDPDFVNSYYYLGVAYYELDFYKEAIEAYKQVIRIRPEDVHTHFGLGLAYFLIGDRNLALNEYKILKDLDVNIANKLFDLIYE